MLYWIFSLHQFQKTVNWFVYGLLLLMVKNLLTSAGDVSDACSIPGSERFPGGGHGNPLQYSCLENPMDRGVWQATVHRVLRVRHDCSDSACMHTCISYTTECGRGNIMSSLSPIQSHRKMAFLNLTGSSTGVE